MHLKESDRDPSGLVVAAKQGSLPAFEQLLLWYEKPIYAFMFRFVRRREDAEDLTQEIFIKVLKSLHAYNIEKPFSPWLYTIATRTAYDWLRKKQRHPELFIIDDEQHPFETIDETESYTLIGDRIDLEALLGKVKPMHRMVLLLYYQKQFSYEQIAEILAVPINTVKTHLYRAKRELRMLSEVQGPTTDPSSS